MCDVNRIADNSKDQMLAYFVGAQSTSADMSKGLEKAASEKANFAVFGPDNAQNARILKGALDSAPKGSLAGVTILYIGGSEQIEEPLKSSATSAGAEIRAAKYSGSGC
jgi:hypothetical protein